MISKQVLDDGKLADLVVQSARTNAGEIARRRAAQFRAARVRDAPDAAAIEAAILADAAMLETQRNTLRDTERGLADELDDDAAVFAERDRSVNTVRTRLVDFRDLVQTNCGAVTVRELGFDGETPREPAALEELGESVLAKVTASPPRATRRGVRFDATAALEGFADEVRALTRANADVRREKREEQAARATRDAAWVVFERELAAAVRVLQARLREVSLDDLADRLAPTRAATAGSDEGAPPAAAPATTPA